MSREPGSATSMLLPGLWVALSLGIGWGVRGNFGHEYGAMIPGALATLAAAILSGREDWQRRSILFAFFGAIGWSFGGSISYMQVIGYTHSGHSPTVLYGFACLFVIGFLWAAIGGAAGALPAVLTRERLQEFFAPLLLVFAAWLAQDWVVGKWFDDSAYRHQSPLYWYDTDWLGVLIAIIVVGTISLVQRRIDHASSLILHLAIGWWVGFLVLVNLLGWRMTPPRGDNWAGCVGMVIGMWIYFIRHRLHALLFASLVCGLIGGFGFAGADLLKLIGISTGRDTNWHSVLEQSYGFINGIGLAVALFWLARRLPSIVETASTASPDNHQKAPGPWLEGWALGFVLLGITWLNFRKNPGTWVKANAMPQTLLGLSAETWFDLAYAALTAVFTVILVRHRKHPLPVLQLNALARSQLLYLVLLWTVVIGNFLRAVVSFAPQRMVTEGVIFANALLCTVGILLTSRTVTAQPETISWSRVIRRTATLGTLLIAISIVAEWAIVRAVYGNRFAGHAAKHIRFGPNATATTTKPAASKPHP